MECNVILLHVKDKYYIKIQTIYKILLLPIERYDAVSLQLMQGIQVEREFNLPDANILQSPTRIIPDENEDHYIMSEKSFQRFVSTKIIMKPTDYDKINDRDFYDGVESILVYDNHIPIFKIEEGNTWKYDEMKSVSKKYVYLRHTDDQVYESDRLEEVELEMFKHYFDVNDPLRN